MWHEARRREKATQKLLTDHRKRADKRREESRIDPSSLLQVHGIKSKIHIDSSTHKQAANSLVVWQGDRKTTIDRFDVRATISSLIKDDEPKGSRQAAIKIRSTVLDADEGDSMRKLLNFERYRLLIQNDLNKVTESTRLRLVSKSEFLCEAKMRKLENNWFGTSAESSFPHTSQDRQSHSHSVRKRSQGASIACNYNQVPPPLDLVGPGDEATDPQEATDMRHVIDLDDCDNLDLDSVVRSNLDSKRVTDIISKYGLNSDEFNLLIENESKCPNLKAALHQLRKLNDKKSDTAMRDQQSSADSTFYGPALPPEMLKKSEANISGDESPSSDGSPVRQRSPSGSSIPLRLPPEEDESTLEKLSEKIDHQKMEAVSRNGQLSSARIVNLEPVSNTVLEKSNEKSLLVADNNGNVAHDKVDGPANSGGESSQPRRAATPLAYKRYRRSSRSLSRDTRPRRKHRARHGCSNLTRDSSSRSQSGSRSSSSSRSSVTSGSSTSRSSSQSSASTRSSFSRSKSRSPKRSRHERGQRLAHRALGREYHRVSSRHRRSRSRDSRSLHRRR